MNKWNGSGTPADGSLVQIKLGPTWTTVKSVATYAGQAVICWTAKDGNPVVSLRDVSELRAAVTAEELKQKWCREVLLECGHLHPSFELSQLAQSMYDKGYRKFEIVEEDV